MSNELTRCVLTPTGNILTPRGRAYFCAIAEKFLSKKDKAKGKTVEKDGTYVLTLVVPPTFDLTLLREHIDAAAVKKWGAKVPGNLRSPIRLCKEVLKEDGSPKYPAELANAFQISAKTFKQRPGVVDRLNNPIDKIMGIESTDELTERLAGECYAGRWMRMSVYAQAYDNESRGVNLYIQNLQVLDHDEKIGGRNTRAEDDFVAVAEDGTVATSAGSADSVFG